jgi:hypothetical protein
MSSDNYYWTSTGNDALCDAMEGLHEGYEPVRPHPFCVCLISNVEDRPARPGGSTTTDCHTITVTDQDIVPSDPYSTDDDDPDARYYEFTLDYEIECLDSEGDSVMGTSDQKSTTFSGDTSDPMGVVGEYESWKSEMLQDIEVEAEQFCPPCPAPAVT